MEIDMSFIENEIGKTIASNVTSDLKKFLNDKIMTCEEVFANANTNADAVFLDGMLEHGGQTNALLMNIGKRQVYIEVMDYIRGLE